MVGVNIVKHRTMSKEELKQLKAERKNAKKMEKLEKKNRTKKSNSNRKGRIKNEEREKDLDKATTISSSSSSSSASSGTKSRKKASTEKGPDGDADSGTRSITSSQEKTDEDDLADDDDSGEVELGVDNKSAAAAKPSGYSEDEGWIMPSSDESPVMPAVAAEIYSGSCESLNQLTPDSSTGGAAAGRFTPRSTSTTSFSPPTTPHRALPSLILRPACVS